MVVVQSPKGEATSDCAQAGCRAVKSYLSVCVCVCLEITRLVTYSFFSDRCYCIVILQLDSVLRTGLLISRVELQSLLPYLMVCLTSRLYIFIDQSELAVLNVYLMKKEGVNQIKNGVNLTISFYFPFTKSYKGGDTLHRTLCDLYT
uniref:Uncharacterized protein n=1 Tax=Hyaloperonospora arabidopsidis (strain Emoy2) TaxID=559515 RepID=M4BCN9_HYAAE